MGTNNSTWRQHVVSQTLLNRFNDGGGPVGFYDVRYGTIGEKSAKGLGYERDFVRDSADETELIWKEVEDPIARAFAEIDQGPEAPSPETVTAVKNFVALHYARSRATSTIHTGTLADAEAELRADTPKLARLAQLKYHGLHLEHAYDIHQEIATEIIAEVRAQEASEQVFRNDLLRLFETTKHSFAGYSLMIRPAIDGAEFILGDCPAVSAARGMNPMHRTPLLDASIILMPLGPRSVVFVYPDGLDEPTVPVGAADAEYINKSQVAQAKNQVFFRRSGRLGQWAQACRPSGTASGNQGQGS